MSKIIGSILLFFLLIPTTIIQAVEQDVSGLVDIRYTFTDGIDSYLKGDYGKFNNDDGTELGLYHAALNYKLHWENNISLVAIGNIYADGVKDNIGFSEAYLQYKSLPSTSGYRLKVRGGFLYPKASVTNVSTAWVSPYTLNYSAINAWLASEMRHQGLEFSITRLGKFSNSQHDFEFTA